MLQSKPVHFNKSEMQLQTGSEIRAGGPALQQETQQVSLLQDYNHLCTEWMIIVNGSKSHWMDDNSEWIQAKFNQLHLSFNQVLD